ncbi:MAG TPA: YCF48-related protein [bacterium]|nr:YCF48-related protein [bacterium]
MKSKNKFIGLAGLGLTLVFIVSGCTIKLGGGSATAEKVDGGIWKSIDSAETWTQKVDVPLTGGKLASIANIDVAKIALDPQDHNTIYLATETEGIIYSYDGGNSWQKFRSLNREKIRTVAVDPVFKCTLYATTGNKLYKSNDCGRFWETPYFHQNNEVVLTTAVIDYVNREVLYLGTSDGEILKSLDGGKSWTTVNYIKGVVIMDIIIDPNNHNFVYAATDDKGIYRSSDSGATWESLAKRFKPFSSSNKYIGLVADKATDGGLIHVSRYGMLRSTDRGDSWQAIELLPAPKNTSIYALAVNPKDSNEIYYSTGSSLVKTKDGGQSWSSQELPFKRLCKAIAIDFQETNIVYLAAFKARN